MLTRQEVHFNLWAFYVCSVGNILPIKYNKETGYVSPRKNKYLLYLWRYQVFISGMYIFFKIFRLFQLLLFDHDYIVSRFCLHFNSSAFLVMVLYQGYYGLVKYPDEFCYLVNSLHNHWTSNLKAFKLSKRLTEYSTHEWVIMLLPISMSSCIWALVLIFVWDPESSQYLYSIIPMDLQSNSVLAVLTVFECWNVTLWVGMCYFSSYQITCFVPKICDDIDRLQSLDRSGVSRISKEERICGALMKLRAEIDIYNQLTSKINIVVKFSCLAMAIFAFFFAVRFMEDSPAVAFINLVFGTYVTLMFTFNYGHAYMIPAKIQETKNIAMLLFHRADRGYIGRRMGAIPICYLSAGNFYSFERMSTPNFIDFVMGQTCGLLLTFP